MKIFIFGLAVCLAASLVLADEENTKGNVAEKNKDIPASDKSSDSKPKRDASHVSGIYHGPSYKYLPPSSISSYDTYSGNVGSSGGYSVSHSSSLGDRGQNNFGFSSSGHHNSGTFHGLGYAPSSTYHTSGHHGLGLTSNHYAGHGSSSGSYKGSVGSLGHAIVRPHNYATGHGYSTSGSASSGIGYKPQSFGGSGSGYHYPKGISGLFSSPSSTGFSSGHGVGSSHGSSLVEVHHGDHVHNGGQEHIYVISSGSSGIGTSHGGVSSVGHKVPTASYLPPVQQHPLPSSSYGVPLTTVGDSYNTKYHSQASGVLSGVSNDHGPAYAAGHKGLGHFSFTSNKPQVLHTSVTGSGFKQPSYSKAPFKPSTFLGAKYEGGVNNDAPGQQYLPPSGVGSDSTGYDYPVPSSSGSLNFHEPNYQQTIEVQSSSVHEPENAYLPPSNNEGSFHELPSAPGASYLPPTNTYGVPYSN